jgi:uracil-DNA glycosylase family 4
MTHKPSSCEGCPLFGPGVGFSQPEINSTGGVLFVGEGPNYQAAYEGTLFAGAAGKHLKWLLNLKGWTREQFSFATIISCHSTLDRIPVEAISHCDPNLQAAIQRAQPKVIVALGSAALRKLCGVDNIDRHRGFVLTSFYGVPVVGTYHPGYLQPRKGQASTTHHIPLFIRDVMLAQSIVQGTYKAEPFVVWEDPSPLEVDVYIQEYEAALALDPTLALACDIETPYKLKAGDEDNYAEIDTTITRVSFGYEGGRAISFPWDGAWMSQIKRLFGSAGRKWWWNGWTFDLPIIQKAGVEVNGAQEDMMWAFHLLQPDLRCGLERVASIYCPDLPPWKHENTSRPAYYSGMDSIALYRIGVGVERELRKTGQWDLYQKHRVKVSPVLREAGTNGIRIHRGARRKLYKKLRKEENRLLREIQPLVPPVLYPRKRYKKFPTVWEGKRTIEPVNVSGEVKVCSNCGMSGVTAATHTNRKGGKGTVPLNLCYKAPIVKRPGMVVHHDVVMDFNPLSTSQLMAYVEFFGHPVGTNRVTKNPTLDDNHLDKLVAKYGEKHPIYALVQELRTVRKTISTYVVGLRPDDRGVVTTEYGFRPATGRLSSRGIQQGEDKGTNLQNIPHRDDHPYADDIRQMIIPFEGYVFVEADSSSIEAVMTGHFMGDTEYMELAQKGIHSYVACKSLGLEFTPENVKTVKTLHKGLYDRKKRVNHGVNYGMTKWLMTALYPSLFPTPQIAQKEIDELYRLLPKLRDFHHSVRVRAAKDTYLVSPWGYRRYFYDVFRYKKDKNGNVIIDEKTGKPKIELGEDGKSVIAQLPQNGAAAFMLDNCPDIAREIKAIGGVLPGNFLVHDSYAVCVPPDKVDAAVEILVRYLTRPIPELNNIRIGCEVKVGTDWGPGMKTVRNVGV